jgi:hypothetical protein
VHQLVADVLAAWREAERLQSTAEPGTPAHAAAGTAIAVLRTLYAELTSSLATDASPDPERAATILGEASL